MQAIKAIIDLPMDEAEVKVRASLAAHGFGVLTEIDVAATLNAKLGIDRAPLKILGACNPTFAHRSLELDPSSSLLLPCNVILEPAAGGGTQVSAVDPRALMPDEAFAVLAGEAAEGLRGALQDASA